MTVLVMVIIRIAEIVRGAAVACVVFQVLFWHAFYAARPWALWGPVAAVAWGCAVIVYLQHRAPRWQVACADSVFYIALALSAGWCVPVGIRGEGGSWLFIVVASQLPMLVWFTPRKISLPLALTAAAAIWAGDVLSHQSHAPRGIQPVALTALFLVDLAVHRTGRRMLYGWATRADAELAAADLDARNQYVILSRNIERREHDRLLHDTVLNTLTAIARSGDAEAVRNACRHSIGLLERALNEPAEPVSSQFSGDVVAAVAQIAGEMRARGLDLHLEVTDDVAAGAASVTAEASGRFPAAVVRAITHATREALVNVLEHAGTDEAWVTVSVTAGAEGEGPRLHISIRDEGPGFDLDSVDLVRLGVRRSIIERVGDAGGAASVESAPGRGTMVALAWPSIEPPSAGYPVMVRPGSASPGTGALAFQTAGDTRQERDKW